MKNIVILACLFVGSFESKRFLSFDEPSSYACYSCGNTLTCAEVVLSQTLSVNEKDIVYLCDECREQERVKGDGKSEQKQLSCMVLKNNEQYDVGASGNTDYLSLQSSLQLKKYLNQPIMHVRAGEYNLMASRTGGRLIFFIQPKGKRGYHIRPPQKGTRINRAGKEVAIYEDIAEVIPLGEKFLLIPKQSDSHRLYSYDPATDTYQSLEQGGLFKVIQEFEGGVTRKTLQEKDLLSLPFDYVKSGKYSMALDEQRNVLIINDGTTSWEVHPPTRYSKFNGEPVSFFKMRGIDAHGLSKFLLFSDQGVSDQKSGPTTFVFDAEKFEFTLHKKLLIDFLENNSGVTTEVDDVA